MVARGGEVIAEGVNLVTASNDPTAHAEVVAIREACRRLGSHQLSGCSIYASCEPCPMCLAAIYWSRADAVYFAATRDDAAAAGFDDSFIYAEIPLPPERRTIRCLNLPLPEAATPFLHWAEAEAKRPY